ncbi:MAG: SDR family oxidoreductase [Patescibacteria group bacterium]
MKNLTKKLTLVTGVGRREGIGFAICREIAKRGGDIFFTYWHQYDQVTFPKTKDDNPVDFIKELEQFGVKVGSSEIDLSQPGSAEFLFEKVKEMGIPDFLINNACYDIEVPFLELTAEILDKHYFVNVRVVTLLCKEFVKQYQKKEGRKIINMTSGQSLGNMGSDKISYTITKASIEMLTKQLASDFAERGINIYALDPGPTDTGWMTNDMKRQIERDSKRRRVNLPEDTAELMCTILIDDKKYTTGEVIHAER